MRLFILLFLLAALVACSEGHVDQTASVVSRSESPMESVQMRRSGCYGTCPIYAVEISSDGRVSYNGQDFVETKGRRGRVITTRDMAFLADAFERVGFDHLQESYRSASDGCPWVWTDNGTVEIVLKRNGQERRVTYYYGCKGLAITDRINWLSETIDEVAGTSEWVSAVPKDVMAWLKGYVATQKTFDGKSVLYPEMPTIVEGMLDGVPSAAVLFNLENITGGGDSVQHLAVFWKRGEHYIFCCSHRVGGTRAGSVKEVTFSEHSLRLTGHMFVPEKDAECCPSKPYVVDVAVMDSKLVDAPRTSKKQPRDP
jgi:hypothetical protein